MRERELEESSWIHSIPTPPAPSNSQFLCWHESLLSLELSAWHGQDICHLCDFWSDSMAVCEFGSPLELCNLFIMYVPVCVCVCVLCTLFRLYYCTVIGIYSLKIQRRVFVIAWIYVCVPIYVCVWIPSSLHWALTFMEPAGHVRAHNDPRERPWAGRELRRCLGAWVLMEAWGREARSCCIKLAVEVYVFLFVSS